MNEENLFATIREKLNTALLSDALDALGVANQVMRCISRSATATLLPIGKFDAHEKSSAARRKLNSRMLPQIHW